LILCGIKILKSAFESTTLRTAGFNSIPQNELTSVSKLLAVCFMFIGGSPASTAGGIKTTTLGVIILLVINYIKGRQEINVFNRKISTNAINRAIVVISISIFIIIMAISALLITEKHLTDSNSSIVDIIFEVVSAFATVGLTLGITPQLTFAGKIVIILLMVIGRLGPITISIALFKKHKEMKQPKAQYPHGNIIIG